MATRRLNGRVAHATLAKRVEVLEAATHVGDEQRAAADLFAHLWEAFPVPLQVYLAGYDVADHPGRSMHLGTLWGVALMKVKLGEDPLRPVAGWLLRDAWNCLGWWHARDLRARGQREMTVLDRISDGLAAEELFGVDGETLHRLWVEDPDGAEWLAVWGRASRDPDVLERAGLGEPELELLEAAATAA